MNSPQYLYDLIKSMSGHEKRYFSLSLHTEKADYLVLFKAIDSMDEWSDDLLKSKLPMVLQSRLPDLKKYLYQLLLRILSQYEASRNPDLDIQQSLMKCEVLLRKNLTKQAYNLLERTKQKSYASEKLYCLPEIILKQMYFIQTGEAKLLQKHQELEKEYSEVMGYLQHEQVFNRLQMLILVSKAENNTSKLANAHAELLAIAPEITYTYSEKKFLTLAIRAGLVLQLHDNAYKHSSRLLKLLLENNNPSERQTREIALAIFNHLDICLQTGKLNEAETWLKNLNAMPTLGIRSRFLIDKALLFHTLPYLFACKPGELKDAISMQESNFEAMASNLSGAEIATMRTILAKAWFIAGQNTLALKQINTFLNQTTPEQWPEPYTICRIMQLLVSYRTNQPDLLGYQLASAMRWIKTDKQAPASAVKIINCLKTLIDANAIERISQIKKLTETLQTAQQDYLVRYMENVKWW